MMRGLVHRSLCVIVGLHMAVAVNFAAKRPSSAINARPVTTHQAKPSPDADEQAVRAAVDEWHNPATSRDAAALRRILAPDFVQTQPPPAPPQTKARLLELSDSPSVVSQTVLDNVRIVVTGDTARVTGIKTLIYIKSPARGRVAFTEVWVRSGSGWQLKSSALESGWKK
jgi:ketosteroid isomerase-like protein